MMTTQTPPVLSGGMPLIGHLREFRTDPVTLMKRGYEQHGNVFAIRMLNSTIAIVSGAENNRTYFMETDKALNVNEPLEFLRQAFGEAAITSPPEKYKNERPLLQSLFSRAKMVGYIRAMQAEVEAWIEQLGEAGTINISDEMIQLTKAVAGHAFIGPSYKDELPSAFWDDYTVISRSIDPILPPNWPLPKFIRRDRARERMLTVFHQIVGARLANPDQYEDMIQLLATTPLKDGTMLTVDQIAEWFLGLMFAGHETTAGQAAWTVIQLLQNPAYLATVQGEIDRFVPVGTQIDGGVMRHLTHIYLAINETTRMRPSAEILFRLVKEPLELDGYTIPVGWRLMVNAANSHNEATAFSNPEQYDPLRFSSERGEGKNSFKIMGFGGGMHKCTGMNFAKNEMAIIVALLLQQFDLELLTPNPTIYRGLGASRPSEALIRYRRKI